MTSLNRKLRLISSDIKEQYLNGKDFCSCGDNPKALHYCPYAVEMYKSEAKCNCCDKCTKRCAMEV